MTQVIQVTHGSQPSNATYFLQQSFLPGDGEVMVISYETGSPQICLVRLDSGEMRQLTSGPGIHPFSAAQHRDDKEIVFTRRDRLCAVDRRTLEERTVARCDGASIGECSISPDGHWLTAAFRRGDERGLLVAGWNGREMRTIAFPRTVIHPQFHPLDATWIEFAGDPAPRMHRVRSDGTGMECLYEHDNDEFVVHETFLGGSGLGGSGLGGSGDLVFTVWPKKLCRMDWSTRSITTIAEYNAWHIAPDRAGQRVLCDTNHPDEGIQIISVADGSRKLVCRSESSNRGSQWLTGRYALKEDFERARAGQGSALSWMEADNDTVYGPQCTHPHPSWSRDESKVVFTSDRSGIPQVYVAEIP
jgi:oligogalacturonide lyase